MHDLHNLISGRGLAALEIPYKLPCTAHNRSPMFALSRCYKKKKKALNFIRRITTIFIFAAICVYSRNEIM